MSAEDKQLVTAADGKIAPQYYNSDADQYQHVKGKDGAIYVNVKESDLPAGAATATKQEQQLAQLEAIVAKLESLYGSMEERDEEKWVRVTQATALNKHFDSIDVGRMSKGGVVAFFEITATATTDEIDCRGYNSIKVWVELSGSGEWKIALKDAATSGGTFVDSYDGATKQEVASITVSRSIVFRGVGDFVKIEATETSDGSTCVIKVQPFNY